MHNDDFSPTVSNCTFSDNTASDDAGGMYNRDSSWPTVSNCTFSDNTASDDGGGMYNDDSSPTVSNCTFSGNRAEEGYGGGMHNDDASPTVSNCTFSGNSAEEGGGMFNGGTSSNGSSPVIANCIFWNDEVSQGSAEIEGNIYSSPSVTYSLVQGGYDGIGNLNADPRFVSATDLHLRANSPGRPTSTLDRASRRNALLGPANQLANDESEGQRRLFRAQAGLQGTVEKEGFTSPIGDSTTRWIQRRRSRFFALPAPFSVDSGGGRTKSTSTTWSLTSRVASKRTERSPSMRRGFTLHGGATQDPWCSVRSQPVSFNDHGQSGGLARPR